MTGRIHSVQSLGTLDGPGVRFVVFVQGCRLRCAYCHNPDTWQEDGGEAVDTEELFRKVMRYRNYFGENGGITVSGGEPLLQSEFVCELFTKCKNAGINTVLDTSGSIINDSVKKLLDVTDLCMLDYKMTTAEGYREYIGCEKSQVDAFLELLSEKEVNTWIRQVIIEGINDNDENILYLKNLRKKYPNISKIEPLAFRTLCKAKYENLGIKFRFAEIPDTKAIVIDKITEQLGG